MKILALSLLGLPVSVTLLAMSLDPYLALKWATLAALVSLCVAWVGAASALVAGAVGLIVAHGEGR